MKQMTREEIKDFARAITGVVTAKSKGKTEKLKKLLVKARPLTESEVAEQKHQTYLAKRREQVRKRKERKALEAVQTATRLQQQITSLIHPIKERIALI